MSVPLQSIRLKRLRCFEDTGPLGLRRLNVFLGANNSGKSSILSAIELMSKREDTGATSPLLASFNSSVRQQWSPREKRPRDFEIEAQMGRDNSLLYGIRHTYARREEDESAFVFRAEHWLHPGSQLIAFESVSRQTPKEQYRINMGSRVPRRYAKYFTRRRVPYEPRYATELISMGLIRSNRDVPNLHPLIASSRPVTVIRPSRLLPRPVYLLDDLTLDEFDREVIIALRTIWSSAEQTEVKARIVKGLTSLGLAKTLETMSGTLRGGRSRTVEVRVATHKPRAESSLADVGFGVSQVLPLVVADAQLNGGMLIVYQPEVHLHPFAQSRLADLFAASMHRGNQIFVETHSEHLILRLQTLMAQRHISPDDVSLFFLENVSGDSRVTAMELDADGIPSGPWPTNFFDVGLELARELARARLDHRSAMHRKRRK